MALTGWLLDETPFEILAQHFRASWGWARDTVAIVRTTEIAARTGRRRAMIDAGVCEIVDGFDERTLRLFAHLRGDASGAADTAEHEAIAVIGAQRRDLRGVFMDKRAAFEALLEIGGDVIATPFDVWADLEARGLVSADVRQGLDDATLKRMQGHVLPLRYQR